MFAGVVLEDELAGVWRSLLACGAPTLGGGAPVLEDDAPSSGCDTPTLFCGALSPTSWFAVLTQSHTSGWGPHTLNLSASGWAPSSHCSAHIHLSTCWFPVVFTCMLTGNHTASCEIGGHNRAEPLEPYSAHMGLEFMPQVYKAGAVSLRLFQDP